MRFKVTAAVGAAMVVAGLLAWVTTAGATTNGRGERRREETITVIETVTSVKPAGNTVTITNDLSRNGQKVGTNQVGCFLTGPGPLAVCSAASVLPRGQILSAASITVPPPPGDTVTAIVGGTGAYSTARGTIDSVRVGGSATTTVTFHVIRW